MFFVHFSRKQGPTGPDIEADPIIRLLTPFGEPDKSGHRRKDGLLAVQCVNWNTARSVLEPAPFFHSATGITIAAWARIDNRHELADKLGFSQKETDLFCDSELILHSYLRWQEDCVHHLIGDFVFALHDPGKQKIFCARDHMGVRPFYYYLSADRFVCATSVRPLQNLKDLSIHIREKWLVDYLTHLSMSFDRTPYEEILKLPPAHCLSVTSDNHRLRQYFTPDAEPELKLKDSREYVDAYREQLETAIKCRVDTTYALGSELSGGIDSSTITAFGARMFAQPLSRFHTFAFANSELEPQYILAVSQASGLPYNHVLTTQNLGRDNHIRRSLAVLGYPVEHGNAVFHEPFYQLAEKFNIRTLLSGFGGDEFCTTIHGYMVPLEMIMQGRYWDLFNILNGNVLYRFLRMVKLGAKKLRSKNFTRPEYTPRFYDAYNRRWSYQIVRPSLVRKYDLKQRYFDQARFDAGYTDLKKFTLENRWAPFVPTRMNDCTLMAAARKIEYRWPLLDIRLVRLFLSIPSEENFFRGMGRYLHRRAIAGVVPDLVTWKKGKDMGNIAGQDSRLQARVEGFSVQEIHPALIEVIDVDKLANQVREITETGTARDMNRMFTIRRAIASVQNLSAWLKESEPSDAWKGMDS